MSKLTLHVHLTDFACKLLRNSLVLLYLHVEQDICHVFLFAFHVFSDFLGTCVLFLDFLYISKQIADKAALSVVTNLKYQVLKGNLYNLYIFLLR